MSPYSAWYDEEFGSDDGMADQESSSTDCDDWARGIVYRSKPVQASNGHRGMPGAKPNVTTSGRKFKGKQAEGQNTSQGKTNPMARSTGNIGGSSNPKQQPSKKVDTPTSASKKT